MACLFDEKIYFEGFLWNKATFSPHFDDYERFQSSGICEANFPRNSFEILAARYIKF
jgi:hypothetical protein